MNIRSILGGLATGIVAIIPVLIFSFFGTAAATAAVFLAFVVEWRAAPFRFVSASDPKPTAEVAAAVLALGARWHRRTFGSPTAIASILVMASLVLLIAPIVYLWAKPSGTVRVAESASGHKGGLDAETGEISERLSSPDSLSHRDTEYSPPLTYPDTAHSPHPEPFVHSETYGDIALPEPVSDAPPKEMTAQTNTSPRPRRPVERLKAMLKDRCPGVSGAKVHLFIDESGTVMASTVLGPNSETKECVERLVYGYRVRGYAGEHRHMSTLEIRIPD